MKAIGTVVDISVSSQIQGWVEKAVKELGPIDAVVANGKSSDITKHRRAILMIVLLVQQAL